MFTVCIILFSSDSRGVEFAFHQQIVNIAKIKPREYYPLYSSLVISLTSTDSLVAEHSLHDWEVPGLIP